MLLLRVAPGNRRLRLGSLRTDECIRGRLDLLGAGTGSAPVSEPGLPGFSDRLEQWLRSDSPKTIGALNEVFAEKSFAVTILLLMLLPALPLPTGGVTHVFEVIALLLAAQMVLGRESVWVPGRWRDRSLGALATDSAIPKVTRWLRLVERISKPRVAWLFDRGWMLRLLGLVLAIFAITAALAPPFTGLDTLPALGSVVVCLAIITADALLLTVGVAIGALGIVLIVTIGAALVDLVTRIV
jgi:hypothetical protein